MKVQHDASTKTYYRCLSCPRFRSTCGGIPTRGMDIQSWGEYMHDVRNHFHISYADIAKSADVSVKTIERIMANNIDQDIMRATARQIELAIIGPVTRHICDMDQEGSAEKLDSLQTEIAALREEVAYWKKENDRKAKIIDKYLE